MRFSLAALSSLCLASNAMAIALADPVPSSTDVAEYSDSLEKRLTIEEMCALLGVGGLVLLNGQAIATYVSTIIKKQSDANSCGVVSGKVDGMNYQYHAKTTGKNCDTTAELKTIKDATNRALDFMQLHKLNAACFRMEHGGTWQGLLQFAGGDALIANGKCDSVTYTLTV